MTKLVLVVGGSTYALAADQDVEELFALLSDPTSKDLLVRLSGGGALYFAEAPSSDWALVETS